MQRQSIDDWSSASASISTSSSSLTSTWDPAERVERLVQLERRWKGKARAVEAGDIVGSETDPRRRRRTQTRPYQLVQMDVTKQPSYGSRDRARLAVAEAEVEGLGEGSSSSGHGQQGTEEREQVQAPWKTSGMWNRGVDAPASSGGRMERAKRNRLQRRDPLEGAGAADGIVLPLDLVGDGLFDVSYSIPVKFGNSEQQFSLQIDTGSSDMWVASTSCSTASCKQTGGRLYDPDRSSAPTGQDFAVKYLSGSASGPIVWDEVTLGGYSVGTQAMASANDVDDEPLSEQFSGILGLALPLNSIISQKVPAGTSNKADGAAWASNLFSITPVSDAPRSRFLSLFLARPGSVASYPPALASSSFDMSTAIPSVLGIGRHPSALVSDPSKIFYAPTVSDRPGSLFWKAQVRGITVYVDGQPKTVDVGRSALGAVFPSAVVDSGVPLILATSAIANAVYGALGIGPADDGMYYVPCKTPLNMSITLDNRPEIPLHPLDLTTEPPSSTSDPNHCIGLIQADDRDLGIPGSSSSSIGDMILGVPFMRNVYTVMAYTVPNVNGTFPDYTNAAAAQTDGGMSRVVVPRLGLMALTDPSKALDEFNTVRVLQQPLGTGANGGTGGSGSTGSGANTGSSGNTKTVNIGGKRLSTVATVLIVIGGLVVLFAVVWASRWAMQRRRRKQRAMRKSSASIYAAFDDPAEPGTLDKKEVYRLARRESSSAFVPTVLDTGALSEEELRRLRYAAFLRREGRTSRVAETEDADEGTLDSQRTLRDASGGVKKVDGDGDEQAGDLAEFGYRRSRGSGSQSRSRSTRIGRSGDSRLESDDEDAEWGDATLALGRTRPRDKPAVARDGYNAANDHEYSSDEPPSSPEQAHFPTHKSRNYSEIDDMAAAGALSVGPGAILHHRQTPSVAVPLLGGHEHHESYDKPRGLQSGYVVPGSPVRSPPLDFAAASSPLPTASMDDGVTTHSRTVRLIDATGPTHLAGVSPTQYPQPPKHTSMQDLELDDPLGEFGVPLSPDGQHEGGRRDSGDGDMAGIGSAASRIGLGRFSRTDSLVFNRESLMSVSSVGTTRPDPPASPPIIPASWANAHSSAP